jgi:hypothetical protein
VRSLDDPASCPDAGLTFELLGLFTPAPEMKREPESNGERSGFLGGFS